MFINLIKLFFDTRCISQTLHTMVKKTTILIFWTKFAQKVYFWSKTGEMNITIEFSIFELA